MQIALFHNLPSGGAKRAVYEWTKRLAKKHQIDVYTLSSADHSFSDIRPYVHAHRIYEFEPRELFHSPFGRLNQLQRWRDLGDIIRISRRIASEINACGYNVVFAHTCLYSFIPAFLQYVEIPSVYYLHEPFGRGFSRPFQRPYITSNKRRETLNRYDPLIKLYNKRLATIQIKSIRRTKRLLANSHFTQEQIRKDFGIDSPVCHYGVDCDTFRPLQCIGKEDKVLSVGELSPRKGFDFVIESLGQIPSPERPELFLACNVVDPSERDYIQSLAAQHEVSLQILTNLNAEELAVEYNKARLCVYAPVLEPFGLVPLEAMSCGTPVVGVREGGVQESIIHEHTGLLVGRDSGEFAQAIQRLSSDPELANEYGRNGREHVLKNWTWEQSVALLESHLSACANVA